MGKAVVTGSATGIGAATRARLEAQGFEVIGVDLKGAEVNADLSTPDGRARAIDEILGLSGGVLDRGVFCAGLGGHVQDIAAVVSVNYFGVVELLDGLKPAFESGDESSVVVICSNSAQMSEHIAEGEIVAAMLEGNEPVARKLIEEKQSGQMAYIASKNAVGRAVRRRAVAWGEAGIRLNGVAPGPTKTPLLDGGLATPGAGDAIRGLPIPLSRWAEPEEMAGVIAFMLGPEAGFVHGAIWYVDGGTDAIARPDRF